MLNQTNTSISEGTNFYFSPEQPTEDRHGELTTNEALSLSEELPRVVYGRYGQAVFENCFGEIGVDKQIPLLVSDFKTTLTGEGAIIYQVGVPIEHQQIHLEQPLYMTIGALSEGGLPIKLNPVYEKAEHGYSQRFAGDVNTGSDEDLSVYPYNPERPNLLDMPDLYKPNPDNIDKDTVDTESRTYKTIRSLVFAAFAQGRDGIDKDSDFYRNRDNITPQEIVTWYEKLYRGDSTGETISGVEVLHPSSDLYNNPEDIIASIEKKPRLSDYMVYNAEVVDPENAFKFRETDKSMFAEYIVPFLPVIKKELGEEIESPVELLYTKHATHDGKERLRPRFSLRVISRNLLVIESDKEIFVAHRNPSGQLDSLILDKDQAQSDIRRKIDRFINN